MTEYERWLKQENLDERLRAELMAIAGNEAEIRERFYRELTFGTGGLRGILGAGTNRMNVYTVGRATFGLASYLLKTDGPKQVVVAYDSRHFSHEFAVRAAEILSSFGIKVSLFGEIMPTPVLSYAVRTLHADAGIVITASHNPKEYNGYKVYNAQGCQITDGAAAEILFEIEKADYFTPYTPDSNKIEILDGKILEDFLGAIVPFGVSQEGLHGLKVVYTPLHGTGNVPVRTMLERMGAQVIVVKEQEEPDGDFTTCPYPNPEERAALSLALEYAAREDADLVLATDPDADRVGVAVPDKKGGFRLLNGNETGVLLLSYMLSERAKAGTLKKAPTVIKTIVTTDMVYPIAAEYGARVKEVLTGFKYIGEEMDKTANFLLGMEESYGYLIGTHVRDKDAVSAAMLIAQMCAHYRAENKTLVDVLEELFRKYGYYVTDLVTTTYRGEAGKAEMDGLLEKARRLHELYFEGEAMRFTDFSEGVDGLPKSNVLRYCNDSVRVVLRPSGTEPKLKIYYQARGGTLKQAQEILERLKAFVLQMLS